jgi:hypothetical protein
VSIFEEKEGDNTRRDSEFDNRSEENVEDR